MLSRARTSLGLAQTILVGGAAVAFLAGHALAGGCDTDCPAGAVQSSDGCNDNPPDTNGGCNTDAANPP